MRQLLIILSLGSLFSCQGQNTPIISSIERRVYIEDSICSNTIAHFDTSEVFLLRSQEILEAIENGLFKKSELELDTFVVYDINLSNKTTEIVEHYSLHLDNMMRLEGEVEGDETFEIDWWFKERDLDVIIIPSSELHK